MKTALIAFSVTITFGAAALAQQAQLTTQPTLIDYPGFLDMSQEVMDYRAKRLVHKDQFIALSQNPDTIILDTRSKEAFDMGHIEGAVHLNFSDFTDQKLAKVIGDKDRPILIYCNNNFSDNVAPFLLKRAPLALNIPTFVNLYGYGYKNIYELGDTISITDPELKVVSNQP